MSKTLDYYNKNADLFKADTVGVEFTEKQNMLLKYVEVGSHILDLGCGSGRDSKAFIDNGYKVTAIDGSTKLCNIASEYIGQDVICMDFSKIDYKEKFDGIWACASLLHVKNNEIKDVMDKVLRSLKVGGYMYLSFKYGEFEGYRNDRYFNDFTEVKFENLASTFKNIKILEINITSDVRAGRENEKWLNIILNKTE